MSGKYFLQSGLRVLKLLVKMDIVYEDKDKIILNMPVAGDGKYGGNMAVQAAERRKGIRIKRGCIALCEVSLKVDGKLYEVKPGFYFCIYVSNEYIDFNYYEYGKYVPGQSKSYGLLSDFPSCVSMSNHCLSMDAVSEGYLWRH